MVKLRRYLPICLLACSCWSLAAQSTGVPAALVAGDVAIEAREDGYHLFVKAAADTGSILLTDSFELPDHRLSTYALRSLEPLPLQSQEIRLLDGKALKQPHNSLVSSTKTTVAGLGTVFHVLIPPVVEYGNKDAANSRWGRVDIRQALAAPEGGFWFSIRTFRKPYADYTGPYRDNAFELKTLLVQHTVLTEDHYEKGLVEGFSRLGRATKANDMDDALRQFEQALHRTGDSLDVVLAIDTTKSMVENLKAVKANLLGPLRSVATQYKSFRIGLVFYRDYMENYLTQVVGFQSNLDAVQVRLNQAQAEGGGDIPEAVVEALYAGVTQFDWRAQNRLLLLMGDAPQHPSPRGQVTEEQMRQAAAAKNVDLQLIMLPQTAF